MAAPPSDRRRRAGAPALLRLGCAALLGGCHLLFPFQSTRVASDGATDAEGTDAAGVTDAMARPQDGASRQDATVDDLPSRDKDRTAGDGAIDGGGGDLEATDGATADAGQGVALWSTGIGGASADNAHGVAVDAAGNVYVVGDFSGTTDFGQRLLSSFGALDGFIASYSPSGVCRWAHALGGSSSDVGYGVAVDASSNVYVVGYFNGTADLGDGKGTQSAGSSDAFVASFDAAGQHRWSRPLGGSSGDWGHGVAVDAQGNVFVVGRFSSTADFVGRTLDSAGLSDIFVASYSASGAYRWAERLGGSATDEGSSIAAGSGGDVCASGYFSGAADLGNGVVESGAGGFDAFVTCFSTDGVYHWHKKIGGAVADIGRGVAVDTGGHVYVTGYFTGPADLGEGQAVAGWAGQDVFVSSFAADGAFRWAIPLGGGGADLGSAVAVAPGGQLYVTGSFEGSASFGAGPLPGQGAEIFVASYASSAGAYRWARPFGGASSESGSAVAVAPDGSIWVVGHSYSATVDLGGPTAWANQGSADAFLIHLAP